MIQKLVNIGSNAFKRKNFSVMAGKVFLRFKEKPKDEAAQAWCAECAEALEPFLRGLDESLWAETKETCAGIETKARAKLEALGKDLGGGGNYPMLYFFTRYLKAKTVVETGVAAGWSSQAVLTALQKNGGGQLYSSDFPYFRYKNPEKLIGYVVDENLKQNWTLYIDGDRNNLSRIAAECGQIDIFHYDSDKSAAGRDYAFETIEFLLGNNALIIFDDVQDNFHFRDFMEGRAGEPFRVFEFQGKYVGLTGPAIKNIKSHADAA